MLSSWIRFLKRPPHSGGGKDPVMSQSTPRPGAAAPAAAQVDPAPAAATPADVSRQIADLTAAVNRLVEAQQQQTQRTGSPGAAPGPSPDIGGDLPGGEPLVAAIDHAKLSPLQQIALGLRGVTPVGLTHPAVVRSRGGAGAGASEDAPRAGAD